MFTPKGRKTVRIKKYIDLHVNCENCGHKKHRFSVYQEFYFIWFIPICASSHKVIKCECLHCGYHMNANKKEYYLSKTRTPFYFFTGYIIAALIFFTAIGGNIYTQFKKKEYIENPRIGDVYLIIDERYDKDVYLYLKLNEIKGDSLVLLHNNVKYKHYVTGMKNSDYFSLNNKITIQKNVLQYLLDKAQMNSVKRNYDKDNRFNIEK